MFTAIDRTTETTLQQRVDQTELVNHVDALADLRRYPASDDQWTAAEYIVDTLEEYGVEVTNHTVEAYTSVPESATLELDGPYRETIDEAITVAFSTNTPSSGLTGDLVALEGPDVTDDLAGKVALLDGLPTPAAVKTLTDANAAAAVFASPTAGHLHEMIASPVWGSPGIEDIDNLPDIPVIEIHQEAGDRLRSLVAGDDVRVTVHATTSTKLRELPCPVGRIDGTESERYVVVGNHIDGWHEGVTDNATAIAATLEIARVFADESPKRGLVFGFWPGHSMGRYAGSTWYADQQWLDLRENGVVYYHLDLVGVKGADRIKAEHMAEAADEHLDAVTASPLELPLLEGRDDDLLGGADRPGRSSDQSFWGPGLSAILSGARFSPDSEDAGPVGGGWWWHTTEDTRDKVDEALLADETRMFVTVCSRYCHSPVLPHDFRATIDDFRDAVDRVATDEATVSFEPIRTRLDTIEEKLDRVADAIDDVSPDTTVQPAIEDLQIELGNELIPALYMQRMDYEHDPGMPHELAPSLTPAADLPELEGPKRRFVETSMTRAVTRIAHRLDRADASVDDFLSVGE